MSDLEYAPPSSLGGLFRGFLTIGARAFGGVLPWAYRAMVEERRWLSPQDFAEVMALCQFLPGPNVGNATIVLGRRWFGWRGAIAAFLGLMALPLVWVLGLAMLYTELAAHPMVRAVVTGVGIAGGGLFIGTAVKLARPLGDRPWGLAIAAGYFAAAGAGRVSMLVVLLVAAGLAWLAARRGAV